MALTRKQKNFINQNFQQISIKDMSQILKISEIEVIEYLKKFNLISKMNSVSQNSKNKFSSIFKPLSNDFIIFFKELLMKIKKK